MQLEVHGDFIAHFSNSEDNSCIISIPMQVKMYSNF